MKITIFGTGYVGLVTGACLAEMGNRVVCVDIDAAKVERLKRGEIPIYEPGLESIVRRNHAGGQLDFTTDAKEGAQAKASMALRVDTQIHRIGFASTDATPVTFQMDKEWVEFWK